MKQMYLRANQERFITKNLYKAIMKRSRLRNRILSDWTEMSRKEYKNQHFANLKVNAISDNKKFWQIVKPLFSNKVKTKTTIKLVENNEMKNDKIEITKLLKEQFVNIVKEIRTIYKRAKCNFHRKKLDKMKWKQLLQSTEIVPV